MQREIIFLLFLVVYAMQYSQAVQHLLFTLWEVPQASMGLSPFELLFGRKLQGELHLIKKTGRKAQGQLRMDFSVFWT